MKMKKGHSYLIGAVILVVIISGCAQATVAFDAINKAKAIKDSTGYSVDYNMEFKYDFSEKTKAGLAKSPSSAGGLGALGALPTLSLKQSIAEKGKNIKSSVDISGITALSQQTQKLPFQKISTYMSGDNFSACLHTESGTACIGESIDELSKKSPQIAMQLKEYKQFSEMTPENILGKFKALYDKGAITLGASGKETIAGRSCDKISYTIILSKLDTSDLMALMGPSGGGEGSAEQFAMLSQFMQTMIKSVSQDMCLDSQHGIVLSSSSSTSIDMTEFIKGMASSLGSQEGGAANIPEELAFTVKASLTATNFKPSAEDSEFLPPKDAKILTSEEMSKLYGTQPAKGLTEEADDTIPSFG